MAPVFKVHEKKDTAIVEKRKGKKRKVDDLNEDGQGDDVVSTGPSPNKKKRNKQRVLLLSSRGITHRMRHLMNDLETLLPHVKKGVLVLKLNTLVGLWMLTVFFFFRFEARFEEPPQPAARTRRFTLV
jgi:hypothetical protein